MTEKKYSTEWKDFMQKEEYFRKAAGNYNQNISLEIQKRDVLLALEDREGQLITTRLMSEDYIRSEIIEEVWERLVMYRLLHGRFLR